MKKWLTFIIFCSLVTYAYASQKTFGDLEVETNLIVHDTVSEEPVLKTDSSNHRVGINTDTPLAQLDVAGTFQANQCLMWLVILGQKVKYSMIQMTTLFMGVTGRLGTHFIKEIK